jgi:hypothetical protein
MAVAAWVCGFPLVHADREPLMTAQNRWNKGLTGERLANGPLIPRQKSPSGSTVAKEYEQGQGGTGALRLPP